MNDSVIERPATWLIAVNAVSALISAGFALAALISPGDLPGIGGGVTSTAHQYAAMYAVRALPIAVALFWFATDRRRYVPILLLAAASQLGDLIIGLAIGTPSLIAGPAIAVLIHGGSAWWLQRQGQR